MPNPVKSLGYIKFEKSMPYEAKSWSIRYWTNFKKGRGWLRKKNRKKRFSCEQLHTLINSHLAAETSSL